MCSGSSTKMQQNFFTPRRISREKNGITYYVIFSKFRPVFCFFLSIAFVHISLPPTVPKILKKKKKGWLPFCNLFFVIFVLYNQTCKYAGDATHSRKKLNHNVHCPASLFFFYMQERREILQQQRDSTYEYICHFFYKR